MKRFLLLFLLLFLVSETGASALSLPAELKQGADGEIVEIAESADGLGIGGVWRVLERLLPDAGRTVKEGLKSVMLQVVIVLLAGIGENFYRSAGGSEANDPTPMAAVFAVTALTVRDMGGMMQSCTSLLTELGAFADALLPTLAASVAATGAVSAAATEQVITAWVSSAMIRCLNGFLPSLVFAYIALSGASASLGDERMKRFASALRKGIGWCLAAVVTVFSLYLSLTHILAGSSDAVTLRVTKAAISSAVPVVGSIISDTAETVLAGAGMMRNAIGVFGLLTVISLCALPFLTLLIRYLAYRVAALASIALEGGRLADYMEEMSGAFSLMLGMIGSAALMLFVSIFASMAVMTG